MSKTIEEAKMFLEHKGYIGANESEKARLMVAFADEAVKAERMEVQARATRLARINTQTVGAKNDLYVTLSQLESIFLNRQENK